MLIECVLKRAEPVIIPIGNETYEFKDDGKGRRVAEVWIESHVECFLAVPHLYRKVEDEPEQGEREDESDDDTGGDALTMSRKDMMAALKAAGVSFKATATNEELRALVAALAPAT